jgi:hypothetical protein
MMPRLTWPALQRITTRELRPGGLRIQPEQSLIKLLIEYRKKKQNERNETTDEGERQRLDVIQNQLKILANATSYGIFIEVITEDKPTIAHAYGLNAFKSKKVSKMEQFGEFFNPLIATMATASARLMLAMAEAWLEQHGGYYAFCDTDSMAVSPFHWKPLQTFFQSLNPYETVDPILKLEHDDRDASRELLDVWFYGISAKRYVLYRLMDGHPVLVDDGWSSHGLGHLLHESREDEESHDMWERKLWAKIIKAAIGSASEKEVCEEYSSQYAVSKYAVTKPTLHQRLRSINRNRACLSQIKPFNFILVGQPAESSENGEPIHPVTKFTKRIEEAPFQPFVDYNSGKRYNGGSQLFWKTLQSVIHDYLNHPEAKFGNGCSTGKMRRRHFVIDKIAYIVRKRTN